MAQDAAENSQDFVTTEAVIVNENDETINTDEDNPSDISTNDENDD